MADKVLLIMAEQDGEPIAGALNLSAVTHFMAATGAAGRNCPSCISRPVTIRPSMPPSAAALNALKLARKACTKCNAAMNRSQHGHRIISIMRALPMRSAAIQAKKPHSSTVRRKNCAAGCLTEKTAVKRLLSRGSFYPNCHQGFRLSPQGR